MAPRRNHGEALRRSHKQNASAAALARREKQTRSSQKQNITDDDGDVMMGGYRIPTVLSSKGAIQHKFDRYAPGNANKRDGHKRAGGRWDEPNSQRSRGWRTTSADTETGSYGEGNHRDRPIVVEDNHYSHGKASRRDRHAREYHHVVASSRIRYEKDGYSSRKHRSSNQERSSGTARDYSHSHYSSNSARRSSSRYSSSRGQGHSSSRYTSDYAKESSSSRYSFHLPSERSSSRHSHYYGREDSSRSSNKYTGPHYWGSGEDTRSYTSSYHQDQTRRYYGDERASADRRHHDRISNFNLDDTFEGSMKSLASHAAKFLKNTHWRDREMIQTAVWKAYGDSIASLGSRNSRRRGDFGPSEWISTRDIPRTTDNDSLYGAMNSASAILATSGGYTASESQLSAASAALRRGMALENYRKANDDYEKSLDELFGSGRSSRIRSTVSSTSTLRRQINTDSYEGSDSGFHTSSSGRDRVESLDAFSVHENSIPSEALTHAQSRSPSVSSDRTITPFHPPCEVPRPKPPPEYPIPVYTPDPSDPTKFLNVPRPRLRQQWHIPADCYNGAAWEDHRKFELETGAISALYPDKWFRGQSFGSAVKDAEGKARAIRDANKDQGPLGRDCYFLHPTPNLAPGFMRSQSVASDLGRGFGAISLDSASASVCGENRAESELSDDFDLYGPPTPPLICYGMENEATTEMPFEQLQALDCTPGYQATQLNGSILDADGDGSQTPRQVLSTSHGLYSSREGSVASEKSTSFNLANVEDHAGNNKSLLDNDLWNNSRQATPSLCLASLIEYDPNATRNILLRGGGSQGSLIDLSGSVPSSPNITRTGESIQSYRSGFPMNSIPESTLEGASVQSRLPGNTILDDWENSFAAIHKSGYPPPSMGGNEKNSTPTANDSTGREPAQNGTEVKPFEGSNVGPNVEADDDLDFMGVDWFLK